MQYNTLGQSDILVSELCLGSMTWGTHTPEADAHLQIETALAHGITMVDTAEMYPVAPVLAETVGMTETVIGNWIEKSGRRNDIVLASKICGPNGGHTRDGEAISADAIRRALDGSLKRLKTDVIDLYQLHWPNRGSYAFRQNWTYDPSGQNRAETRAHMEDVLGALQREVDAGRIRQFGLSNESAWGTMAWLAAADAVGGPRVQSIQNEYSLLYRLYDTDMAEVSANEQVGLLAYSPLAAGLLTGKYRNGAIPEGSRATFADTLGGRMTPRSDAAVAAYLTIAERHGLDPIHMALAFCKARPFMTSVIFGATTQAQLEHILAGADLILSDDVLTDLNTAHRDHPMPY
ncbi:aldo/keto reductase [Pseudoruegeria sp. SK021]|uniref:aldo/keto reductase n=1 Tax=Pseudoruegeria sp. SK021 TaxID=1933035 RepID=UPI000A237C9A|nr:aldo/keto reductase [Pseudoruegeria sp. SK021]OSP54313.1 aldo/keto reductase [Pseudoruegeria sp. SK021]